MTIEEKKIEQSFCYVDDAKIDQVNKSLRDLFIASRQQ